MSIILMALPSIFCYHDAAVPWGGWCFFVSSHPAKIDANLKRFNAYVFDSGF